MIQTDDLTTKIWFYLGEKGFVSIFAVSKLKMIMNHDVLQQVSSRGDRAQDAEKSRIAAVADELQRLCSVHEAQSGTCQENVIHYIVLVDKDGDIYVVDAEIKQLYP